MRMEGKMWECICDGKCECMSCMTNGRRGVRVDDNTIKVQYECVECPGCDCMVTIVLPPSTHGRAN